MGDEAYCRHILVGVGGKGSHQVTVVVECNVFESHLLYHRFEMACECHLSGVDGVRLVSLSLWVSNFIYSRNLSVTFMTEKFKV